MSHIVRSGGWAWGWRWINIHITTLTYSFICCLKVNKMEFELKIHPRVTHLPDLKPSDCFFFSNLCHHHHHPHDPLLAWISLLCLATRLYRPSLPGGHQATSFIGTKLLNIGYRWSSYLCSSMWKGSIGVHRLWVRPYFSSSVPHNW